MNKENVAYTYSGLLFSLKKKEIPWASERRVTYCGAGRTCRLTSRVQKDWNIHLNGQPGAGLLLSWRRHCIKKHREGEC